MSEGSDGKVWHVTDPPSVTCVFAGIYLQLVTGRVGTSVTCSVMEWLMHGLTGNQCQTEEFS